ncbi:MAG: hypothetical protein AAF400_01645 [Bacteroidota bacterium]
MATTRLQRKSKRNKIKAAQRRVRLRKLLNKPVDKAADVDQIKATFKHSKEGALTS